MGVEDEAVGRRANLFVVRLASGKEAVRLHDCHFPVKSTQFSRDAACVENILGADFQTHTMSLRGNLFDAICDCEAGKMQETRRLPKNDVINSMKG